MQRPKLSCKQRIKRKLNKINNALSGKYTEPQILDRKHETIPSNNFVNSHSRKNDSNPTRQGTKYSRRTGHGN